MENNNELKYIVERLHLALTLSIKKKKKTGKVHVAWRYFSLSTHDDLDAHSTVLVGSYFSNTLFLFLSLFFLLRPPNSDRFPYAWRHLCTLFFFSSVLMAIGARYSPPSGLLRWKLFFSALLFASDPYLTMWCLFCIARSVSGWRFFIRWWFPILGGEELRKPEWLNSGLRLCTPLVSA